MSVDYTGKNKETSGSAVMEERKLNVPPLDISTNNCTPIFLALLGAMVHNKGIGFYSANVNTATLKSRIDELKRAEKKILEALNE